MNVNAAGARPDINQLLDQMRGLRDQAQGAAMDQARVGQQQPLAGPAADVRGLQGPAPVAAPERASFTDTLGKVLGDVNQTQLNAAAAQTAFVRGERTDLVNVMVAAQKASVSFQAVTQVRNRLVEAYKDVMNMPI